MPAGRAHKEEKKEIIQNTPKQARPEDLKYVGVQETGLAMTAANALQNRKKELEKALKENE